MFIFALAILIHWRVAQVVAIIYVIREWPMAIIIIGIGHIIFGPPLNNKMNIKINNKTEDINLNKTEYIEVYDEMKDNKENTQIESKTDKE